MSSLIPISITESLSAALRKVQHHYLLAIVGMVGYLPAATAQTGRDADDADAATNNAAPGGQLIARVRDIFDHIVELAKQLPRMEDVEFNSWFGQRETDCPIHSFPQVDHPVDHSALSSPKQATDAEGGNRNDEQQISQPSGDRSEKTKTREILVERVMR